MIFTDISQCVSEIKLWHCLQSKKSHSAGPREGVAPKKLPLTGKVNQKLVTLLSFIVKLFLSNPGIPGVLAMVQMSVGRTDPRR